MITVLMRDDGDGGEAVLRGGVNRRCAVTISQ